MSRSKMSSTTHLRPATGFTAERAGFGRPTQAGATRPNAYINVSNMAYRRHKCLRLPPTPPAPTPRSFTNFTEQICTHSAAVRRCTRWRSPCSPAVRKRQPHRVCSRRLYTNAYRRGGAMRRTMHSRSLVHAGHGDAGRRDRRNRSRDEGGARHAVGADHGVPGVLDERRLRARGERPLPGQERRQHPGQELHRLRAVVARLLGGRLRPDVRRRRPA